MTVESGVWAQRGDAQASIDIKRTGKKIFIFFCFETAWAGLPMRWPERPATAADAFGQEALKGKAFKDLFQSYRILYLYFPGLFAIERPDDSGAFELIHDSSGSIVA